MIVVAIVAILTAIVMPSYARHIQRGRLTEAVQKLSDLRTQLEVFYQDNRAYGTAGTGCGVATASSDSGFFSFACYLTSDPAATTQTDAQSFVLHATGTGLMAGFEYTVDHSSGKQTRAFVGRGDVPVACWVTRVGDAC